MKIVFRSAESTFRAIVSCHSPSAESAKIANKLTPVRFLVCPLGAISKLINTFIA